MKIFYPNYVYVSNLNICKHESLHAETDSRKFVTLTSEHFKSFYSCKNYFSVCTEQNNIEEKVVLKSLPNEHG
jgi:hypothetical protein